MSEAERVRAGYVPITIVSLDPFTPRNGSMVSLASGQCIADSEDKVIHATSVQDEMVASQ